MRCYNDCTSVACYISSYIRSFCGSLLSILHTSVTNPLSTSPGNTHSKVSSQNFTLKEALLTRIIHRPLMAPKMPNNGDEPRRRPLQAYNSFPRIDADSKDSSRRSRASTSDASSPNVNYENESENDNQPSDSDSPASMADRAGKESDKSVEVDTAELPPDFDALPVELISLTDT